MRIQRITAAVVAAALMLTGCSSLSLNGSEILSPPRAAGDRAELQRMIEDDTGGSYELIYPAEGDYKSGVILHDMNDDGSEEAVALYRSAGGARVLIAQKQGDKYRAVGYESLSSSDAGSLRFADLNGDGTEELLISCSAGSADAALTACFIGEELKTLTVAEGFTDYLTGDFDGNAAEDVLVLIPPSAEASAKAELTVCTDGAFEVKSSCEVDPAVTSYAELTFGRINDELNGAALDGVTVSGKYTTQLLYYDANDHSLINPLFVASGYSDTSRTAAVFSTDIDGDSVTEIPLCALTEHEKKEDISHVCTMVRWCTYEPVQLAPIAKHYTMLCDALGFQLSVDEEQTRLMTARYDAENTFTIHEVDYEENEPKTGRVLLTIRRYDAGSFDSSVIPEAVLYENNTATYTYVIADDSPFTDTIVKNSFIPMQS